jgi:hypothetical protein
MLWYYVAVIMTISATTSAAKSSFRQNRNGLRTLAITQPQHDLSLPFNESKDNQQYHRRVPKRKYHRRYFALKYNFGANVPLSFSIGYQTKEAVEAAAEEVAVVVVAVGGMVAQDIMAMVI